MKAGYLVCAESAVVDQSSQNLSIYNIFENLTVPLFPVRVPMSVVVHLIRAPNEKDSQDIRLRFRLDKEKLADQQIALDFQGKPATRVVARIQPIILPRPGNLTVELIHKRRTLDSWNVIIIGCK